MLKPTVLFIATVFAMASADTQVNLTLWTAVVGVLECLHSTLPYKIADPMQCDKYYVCQNGTKQEFLCPDGTAFQFNIQSCVYLVQAADCKGILQAPKPSERCPRQYGYFPSRNPPICNKYLHCQGGVATEITCPDDLVFDPKVGVCDKPDKVDTSYCLKVTTSADVRGNGVKSICHRDGKRHGEKLTDTEDCRRFFVCSDEGSALLMSCPQGMAFNPITKECGLPSLETCNQLLASKGR